MRDKRQYARFKTLSATHDRQAMFRRWLVESFLLHGVIAVLCLVALGQSQTLTELPEFLRPLSSKLTGLVDNGPDAGFMDSFFRGLFLAMVPAMLVGSTAARLARTYSEHKSSSQRVDSVADARDVTHLLPLNRDERFWTGLLAINAGLSEELFFRLLAPLLFYLVTGSAMVAVIAGTLWFGFAHYYQGWLGILVTTLIGALLMFVYLYTGSIWLVIVIHAVWDLNDLALAPWFADWLKKRESSLPGTGLP